MELILDADLEDLQFWMVEADEQLQVLDEDLIRLERESDDEDLLQRIFRAAHTLKGSSGTIKHNRMAHLTHAMEGVLDELRDDKMSVTSDLIDVLLDSLDNLGLLKDEVTTLTVNDDIPVDELVDRLNALREASEAAADDTEAAEEPAADAAPAAKPAFSFDLTEAQQDVIQSATVKGDSVFHINVGIDPESALLAARKLQLLTEAASAGEVLVSVPTMDEVMEESSSTDLDLLLVTKESEAAVHSALSVILDVQDIAIVSFEATEEAAAAGGQGGGQGGGHDGAGGRRAAGRADEPGRRDGDRQDPIAAAGSRTLGAVRQRSLGAGAGRRQLAHRAHHR